MAKRRKSEKADGKIRGKIAVISLCNDGTAREVLLDDNQRYLVSELLMQMFPNKSVPVSETTLPLEHV